MVNAVIFQQKSISKWNGPVSQGFNIPTAPTSSERQFPFNCRLPVYTLTCSMSVIQFGFTKRGFHLS